MNSYENLMKKGGSMANKACLAFLICYVFCMAYFITNDMIAKLEAQELIINNNKIGTK